MFLKHVYLHDGRSGRMRQFPLSNFDCLFSSFSFSIQTQVSPNAE